MSFGKIAGKVAILLAGGATVAGIGYVTYNYLKLRKDAQEDEGFEELSKTIEESKEKRVLVLGLDNAGKSAVLACMENNELQSAPKPTEGFNVMCVQKNDTTLNIWEIGGDPSVRKYWHNFIQDTDILVFVVDSADTKRHPEAYDELHIQLGDERLKHVPIVIVANKQDLAGALKPHEIQTVLGLDFFSPKDHKVQVIGTETPLEGIKKGHEHLENLLMKL
ncbi:unnamed protein product [Owenia fusiformis]|uniref:Uncharacterized protein n=1 Tax=Owenia fusiformis TaxID=6347 RepID=A0A8J1XHG2_OWEFU|nr:unnamed protein product [Owenia fusiformis]